MRRVRSVPTSSGWSDQPQPPDCARRAKRSTPLAGRVPSGSRTNVKLQPAGLDRGRRRLRQLRRFGPCWLRRTNVKLRSGSVPSWAKPVQQGSCTQVSMVGNRGESQTVPLLLPDLFSVEYALQAIRAKPVDSVHKNIHKSSCFWYGRPGHSRARHFRQSPKVILFRYSAFFSSLRVSERAVLRQVI